MLQIQSKEGIKKIILCNGSTQMPAMRHISKLGRFVVSVLRTETAIEAKIIEA